MLSLRPPCFPKENATAWNAALRFASGGHFPFCSFIVTFSLRVGRSSGYAVCAPKRRKMRFGAGALGEKSEKAEHLGNVRLVTYSDILRELVAET